MHTTLGAAAVSLLEREIYCANLQNVICYNTKSSSLPHNRCHFQSRKMGAVLWSHVLSNQPISVPISYCYKYMINKQSNTNHTRKQAELTCYFLTSKYASTLCNKRFSNPSDSCSTHDAIRAYIFFSFVP